MDVLELERIEASLTNPDDPAEVTLVAEVAGVGKTHRLASGQTLTWTPEALRKFAPSLIGKPVNVRLDRDATAEDDDSEPTGHSTSVIGAITKSVYDEASQAVRVEASLWRHYFGSTVARLKNIGSRLQVSIEMLYSAATAIANSDGSITPTEGEFSGLGIVRVGADPRNRVLLLASLAEDEASREESVTDRKAIMARFERFIFGEDAESNSDTPPVDEEADNKVIDASQADADPEEDAALATELTDEQKAAERAELLAEIQPQLDAAAAIKAERDALLAEKTEREQGAAKDALAASRAEELETILPVKTDAGKTRRLAAVRELDEAAYEALKAELVEAAEPKGGIHSDAEAHAAQDEPDAAAEAELQAKYRAEMHAAQGNAAPDKE